MLASAPANLPQKLISAHLLPSSLLEVVENALQGEGDACGVGDVEKGERNFLSMKYVWSTEFI